MPNDKRCGGRGGAYGKIVVPEKGLSVESGNPLVEGTGRIVIKYGDDFLSNLPSFSSKVDDILIDYGINRTQLNDLIQTNVEDITDDTTKAMMKQIRDEIPTPTQHTVMQKVVSIDILNKYLDGE